MFARIRMAVAPSAILFTALISEPLQSQERRITLGASPELIENGFLKYVLPRFTLKHRVRVTATKLDDPSAQAFLTPDADKSRDGRPVFADQNRTYHLALAPSGRDNDLVTRFADWLASEVGQRTVTTFAIDGKPVYTAAAVAETVEAKVLDGDAAKGAALSSKLCGRCHVIDKKRRIAGIGSTPSFALLRSLPDWESRFGAFYTLNPHPSFTQVADVTEPFHPERPPPISPLEMSLDDIDNILAFVSNIKPADLGAPIQHQ